MPSVTGASVRHCACRTLPWLLVVYSIVQSIVMGGTKRGFGVFVDEIKFEYRNHTSMLELDAIPDIEMAISVISAVFFIEVLRSLRRFSEHVFRLAFVANCVLMTAGLIASSYVQSTHLLFATYTLPLGVGIGMFVAVVTTLVGEHFDATHRFHIFATTVVFAGPFGVILMTAVYTALIHHMGWRMSLRVMSLAAVGLLVPAPLLANTRLQLDALRAKYEPIDSRSIDNNIIPSKTPAVEPSMKSSHTWAQLRFNICTYLWIVRSALHQLVYYNVAYNLSHYVTMKYRTNRINSLGQLCFTIGTALAYVSCSVWGYCTRKIGPILIGVLVMSYASTIVFALWQFVTLGYAWDMVFAGWVGFLSGVGSKFAYSMGEEVLGVHGSFGYSVTLVGSFIGMATAPLTSGLIVDRLGFGYFFGTQAIICLVESVVQTVVTYICHNRAPVSTEIAMDYGTVKRVDEKRGRP